MLAREAPKQALTSEQLDTLTASGEKAEKQLKPEEAAANFKQYPLQAMREGVQPSQNQRLSPHTPPVNVFSHPDTNFHMR
jgi:hypothetical protein